jgi:hypothetical protein
MYKHLLDQEVKKVLSLSGIPARHDGIEVIHYLVSFPYRQTLHK